MENILEVITKIIFIEQHEIFGKVHLLSVKKKDNTDNISWSDLQKIKNEVFGEDSQALEGYPKEKDVINHANVRHLWIIDKNYELPFSTK